MDVRIASCLVFLAAVQVNAQVPGAALQVAGDRWAELIEVDRELRHNDTSKELQCLRSPFA